MKLLVLVFLLIVGFLVWKNYYAQPEPGPPPPIPGELEPFTVEPRPPSGPPTELTDAEGRTISISEITRYEHYVRFTRASDGRVFDVTLNQLSPESRQRVESMEITADPRAEDIDHAAVHRARLEERIEALQRRIHQIRDEMSQAGAAQRASFRRQIDDLEGQISVARQELRKFSE